MAYQQRDNSGQLFKNGKKEKDTHPDYRGEALIDGVAYYMDAWLKTAESGRRWMSFSFKPKQAPQQQSPAAPKPTHGQQQEAIRKAAQSTAFEDMDSDIAF